MTRVALYARVSTVDQDPQVQLDELRALAAQRGWTAVEYIDHGVSAARLRMPARERMLEDAKRGRLDLVVVWRLDRLGRSVLDLLHVLHGLTSSGVGFLSVRDPGLDTTSAVGRLLVQLLAAFAEFERALIIERTRAGLARARARGTHLGRPMASVSEADAEAAVREHGSIRAAARALGVSVGTLHGRVRKTPLQEPAKVGGQP